MLTNLNDILREAVFLNYFNFGKWLTFQMHTAMHNISKNRHVHATLYKFFFVLLH